MILKPNDPGYGVLSTAPTDSTTANGLSCAILAARGAANLRERVMAKLAGTAPNVMDLAANRIAYPHVSDHVHALASPLDHFAVVKDDGIRRGPADALCHDASPTILRLGQRDDAAHIEAWGVGKQRELLDFFLLTLGEDTAETARPPARFRAPRRPQSGGRP
jgi:hypothetical protein